MPTFRACRPTPLHVRVKVRRHLKAGSSSLPEKLDPSRVRVEIKDGTATRKVAFASLSYDQLRASGTRLTLSGVEFKQLVALGKALAKLKV